jgi:hypothetical protein
MAGRPKGSQNKDKPLRDALRMEAALLEAGEDSPAKVGSLRYIARQQLLRACEDTAAFREIADRLDGKPAQAVEMSGGMAITHEEALDELE